ncbi:hypothetical protein EYE35_21110 [Cereibacter sphaeroides]|nr:hypothetical protein EYE35_21110 [Cereibacter sphaeroides]
MSEGADSYTILCGLCGAPVNHRVEGDPNSDVGCSTCDNWAKHEEVMSIVSQYVHDETQAAINRSLKDAARGSKFMTFRGKTTNDKKYRFVVDLQLS